jgi:hypothetical protein
MLEGSTPEAFMLEFIREPFKRAVCIREGRR